MANLNVRFGFDSVATLVGPGRIPLLAAGTVRDGDRS
jgi:hypothetical protein